MPFACAFLWWDGRCVELVPKRFRPSDPTRTFCRTGYFCRLDVRLGSLSRKKGVDKDIFQLCENPVLGLGRKGRFSAHGSDLIRIGLNSNNSNYIQALQHDNSSIFVVHRTLTRCKQACCVLFAAVCCVPCAVCCLRSCLVLSRPRPIGLGEGMSAFELRTAAV